MTCSKKIWNLRQKSQSLELNTLTKNTKTINQNTFEKPHFEKTDILLDKKKYRKAKLRKPSQK